MSEVDSVHAAVEHENYMVVYPPTSQRGLRHAVFVGGAPKDTTLCGKRCDGWYYDHQSDELSTVGCKRCRKALGLKPR